MRGTGRRKSAKGSTLIEFALIVMVLLTLLLGVVEFSRALYAYHFVGSAARQAARWAAVNGANCGVDTTCNGTGGMNSGPASSAEIQDYAKNLTPEGINRSDVTATATWPLSGAAKPAKCVTYPDALGCDCYGAWSSGSPAANDPGCTVEVTVNYDFHFIFPFVHVGTLTLSSTSESIITH